jgi:cytochrome c oxidase subunit 4
MANIAAVILRNAIRNAPAAARWSSSDAASKIGSREIVGYGWNGQPIYYDRVDYPMPAIRFREDSKEIKVLREKEKGDWKKLSLEERKALYRTSFCQTFAEIKAPTGEWKQHIGAGFIAASLAILFAAWMNAYVYPESPITLDEEHQKAQLKRMIDLEINPISGLASKWDYEKGQWK